MNGILKKEKFHCGFICVYSGQTLTQDTFSQFTMKLISVNKCTAFDLKFRQSGALLYMKTPGLSGGSIKLIAIILGNKNSF